MMTHDCAYVGAWSVLYRIFGERLETENIDLMEAVLETVKREQGYGNDDDE